LTVGETASFGGVPGGVYDLALRSVNAGGVSSPTTAVGVVMPSPCTGAPLPPTNFLFYKSGANVFLIWDPPATGAAPTSYVLNVTSAPFTGAVPLTVRAFGGAVPPGAYSVSVAAVNACGTGAATSVQAVTVP
jgi:hypothetical protein